MGTAFDITIVLENNPDDYHVPDVTELMNLLHRNELQFYGQSVPSANGKPIVYLCRRDYPQPEPEEE